MKKKYYFILLVTLFSIATQAQINSVNVKLDEKIAVKFPSDPEKKTGVGMANYVFKSSDSVIYGAVVVDFKVTAHLDSANLATMKDTQQFADELRLSLVSRRKNYVFGDIKLGKWKGYTKYYMSGIKDTDKGKVLMFMILIGSKMYTFTYYQPEVIKIDKSDEFFNSIEILQP